MAQIDRSGAHGRRRSAWSRCSHGQQGGPRITVRGLAADAACTNRHIAHFEDRRCCQPFRGVYWSPLLVDLSTNSGRTDDGTDGKRTDDDDRTDDGADARTEDDNGDGMDTTGRTDEIRNYSFNHIYEHIFNISCLLVKCW